VADSELRRLFGVAIDDTLILLNTVSRLNVDLAQGINTLNLAAGSNRRQGWFNDRFLGGTGLGQLRCWLARTRHFAQSRGDLFLTIIRPSLVSVAPARVFAIGDKRTPRLRFSACGVRLRANSTGPSCSAAFESTSGR
jgi:hypothetical protein